mgnify:CR=1 FL=1
MNPKNKIIIAAAALLSATCFYDADACTGISLMQDQFVTEGLNEAGLSAGLFFFPGYGKYEDYDASRNASTIVDVQLAAWILGNFATVDEVISNIGKIRIVALSAETQTAHWRIGDASGRQVVLEIGGGVPEF